MAATNKFRPGLTLGDYYPEAARNIFTPEQARREYARLRKIANRRLEALSRNYPESAAAREFRGGFPAAKGETDRRIYQRLYDVARYMNRKLSTVTGEREYRKKMIASLHEIGYTFINKSNFDQFTQFMDEVKTHRNYRSYDSERIVELFKERVLDRKASPQAVASSFELFLSKEGEAVPEETRPAAKSGTVAGIFSSFAQDRKKRPYKKRK